jgi:hypothetical protein
MKLGHCKDLHLHSSCKQNINFLAKLYLNAGGYLQILFTASFQVIKRITFLCCLFSYIRYSVVQPTFYVPCDINISVPGCRASVAGFSAKEQCSNKFSLRSHQEMGM